MAIKNIYLTRFDTEEEYKNSGLVYDLNVSLIGNVTSDSEGQHINGTVKYHDSRYYDGGKLRLWVDDFPSEIDWNETGNPELSAPDEGNNIRGMVYNKYNYPLMYNWPQQFMQMDSEEDMAYINAPHKDYFNPYVYTGRQVTIDGADYYIWRFDSDSYSYQHDYYGRNDFISPDYEDNTIGVYRRYDNIKAIGLLQEGGSGGWNVTNDERKGFWKQYLIFVEKSDGSYIYGGRKGSFDTKWLFILDENGTELLKDKSKPNSSGDYMLQLDGGSAKNYDVFEHISIMSAPSVTKYLLTTSIDYEELKSQSLWETLKDENVQLGDDKTKFKAFFAIMSEDNTLYWAKENAHNDSETMYLCRVDKLVDYYLYIDNLNFGNTQYTIQEWVACDAALGGKVFRPMGLELTINDLDLNSRGKLEDLPHGLQEDTKLYAWINVPTRVESLSSQNNIILTTVNPEDEDAYDKLFHESLQYNYNAYFKSYVASIDEDTSVVYATNDKNDAWEPNNLSLFKIKKIYKHEDND